MMKILTMFFILVFTSNAFAAELLVKAKKHYMDDFTQEQVDKMTVEQRQSYEARSQIGDVIVVRPDGWKWGKEECLPNFVVIKMPDVTMEEAKKYEEQMQDTKEVTREMTMLKSEYNTLVKDGKLTEKATAMMSLAKVPTITATKSVETAKGTEQSYTLNATVKDRYLKRLRKYQVPKEVVDEIKLSKSSNTTVESKNLTSFIANITDKTK